MHWSICDFIADIAHNALHAEPDTVEIRIIENPEQFCFTVCDDGYGMTPEQQKRALDPFYSDRKHHPDRKVGLGLPMLVQTIESTGGSFKLESKQGQGTSVYAEFSRNNIDTPPIGDICSTVCSLLMYGSGPELIFYRSVLHKGVSLEYQLSRNELIETVGDMNDIVNIGMVQTYVRSHEDRVKGVNNHGSNEP
ncbi:ATP-binding protein [Spirochaeta dissipatitropha]